MCPCLPHRASPTRVYPDDRSHRLKPAATACLHLVDCSTALLGDVPSSGSGSASASLGTGSGDTANHGAREPPDCNAPAHRRFTFRGTGIRGIGARGTEPVSRMHAGWNRYRRSIRMCPRSRSGRSSRRRLGGREPHPDDRGDRDAERASTSPFIVVDAPEVIMSGTRHQDTDSSTPTATAGFRTPGQGLQRRRHRGSKRLALKRPSASLGRNPLDRRSVTRPGSQCS